VSHTRKADMTYRGPQVIAGDCDNMIYVERLEKELRANVRCQFFRNAAEFEDFGFTCAPEKVTTDIGPKISLPSQPSLRPRRRQRTSLTRTKT
jgi:hypothetical protein